MDEIQLIRVQFISCLTANKSIVLGVLFFSHCAFIEIV